MYVWPVKVASLDIVGYLQTIIWFWESVGNNKLIYILRPHKIADLRFMPSKLANIIFLSMDVMVEDSLVATSTRKQWKTPCKSTYRHVMAFHRSYSFYDELHPISGLHFCSSIAFASHSSMSYMYTHILLCMTLDMCTSRLLWAPEHLMQMKKTKSHWSAFHLQIHQTIPIRFHALHV